METNKRTKSIPIMAALIVVIMALAASTIYFAYVAKSGNPATSKVSSASSDPSRVYSLPYAGSVFQGATGSGDQTGDASSGADSITVSGTGGASYTPNEALVSVSVETNSATAEAATSSDAAATLSVIRALNGIGVSNSSIETQGYSLSTDYADCDSSCIPQIIGYTVSNNLQVNITSSVPSQLGLQAGRVIDTAVAAGANQISLSFAETSSVLAKLTNGALQQAVASAYGQAQTIAGSLGVNVTGVISASEGSSYTPQYYGEEALYAMAVNSVSTPIMPGTQSMSVTVQVVYAIG
jgi:hypothetical protein